jgi:hypothetical protein
MIAMIEELWRSGLVLGVGTLLFIVIEVVDHFWD